MNTTKIDTAAASSAEREQARVLEQMIANHQYGLRGFGDGSLSRGRNLTDAETRIIRAALRAFESAAPAPATSVQQPVAWMQCRKSDGFVRDCYTDAPSRMQREIAEIEGDEYLPLYAAPIQQAAPAAVVPTTDPKSVEVRAEGPVTNEWKPEQPTTNAPRSVSEPIVGVDYEDRMRAYLASRGVPPAVIDANVAIARQDAAGVPAVSPAADPQHEGGA